MDITDEQIRAACRVYDLDPVGHVPVTGYEVDLDPDNKEEWDGDACWELASQVVDGEIWPDAGPLGFAAGHRSPGWKFLRDLCDQVASDDIGSDWFAALSYDGARDHMRERAEDRARLETWPQALVCVADLGVNTITEEAKAYLTGEPSLDTMAWDLLSYAGYLVLREVFAPQIDSKQKD